MPLPRIIHQIWFQGADQIPEKYHDNIKILKELHPKWKYKLWDEKKMLALLSTEFPIFLDTYRKFTYMHQKIDFFKFAVLYHYGGVYVDIDARVIKSFEYIYQKFPDSQMLVSKMNYGSGESFLLSGYNYIINNGIILSQAQHPFLLHMLHRIKDIMHTNSYQYLPKFIEISFTTGPSLLTIEINKYQGSDIKLLSYDYLEPCRSYEKKCTYTENTCIDHQHNLTWLSPWQKVLIYSYINNTKLFFYGIINLLYLSYLFWS